MITELEEGAQWTPESSSQLDAFPGEKQDEYMLLAGPKVGEGPARETFARGGGGGPMASGSKPQKMREHGVQTELGCGVYLR